MIKRPTVFIIGAGASKEARLPTGPELTGQIANCLDMELERGELVSGDENLYRALVDYGLHNGNGNRVMRLFNSASQIREGMHQVRSIDTFLDTHKDDELLVACGKIAIAHCILNAEHSSDMYDHDHPERLNWNKLGDTWYRKLWHCLSIGVDKVDVARMFDNVAFVIFNYDRCIELFIYDGLRNHFRLSDSDAKQIANKVGIYHPYGSLGPLRWQNLNIPGVDFGGVGRGAELVPAAANIRTFTEQVADKASLEKMRKVVSSAERIVFMGFGFHKQNIDLLAGTVRDMQADVIGTATGISRRDVDIYKSQLTSAFRAANFSALVDLYPVTCSELFHEFGLTLTM